jgi:hypothetical protein
VFASGDRRRRRSSSVGQRQLRVEAALRLHRRCPRGAVGQLGVDHEGCLVEPDELATDPLAQFRDTLSVVLAQRLHAERKQPPGPRLL